MERRTFLRWAVHGLGAVFGAVLGFPAVVYLIDPRNRPPRETGMHPVGRTNELAVDVPREVVIHETRYDAWTLHPNDIVGRVWVVRRDGTDAQDRPNVEVFTTTCPHLGCSINSTGRDFLCPCHGAHYELDGEAIRQDKQTRRPINNPAPRNMDSLPIELERIPGTPDYLIKVKYEKFKPNSPQKERIA
jgi:menaquinol-cytochrome c reductase iron-sulfur subunit